MALKKKKKFVALGLWGADANGKPAVITKAAAEAIGPFHDMRSLPRDPSKHGFFVAVAEAVFFDSDPSEPRPYGFIPRLFAERARLKREEPGNVTEQNIKLCLNSLSGKAAQSIGGSEDSPPATACPWYAAATTAGTRRRMIEAALHAPFDIVQFSTDGLVSLEPLPLDIGEDLGQWEYKRIPPGERAIFLQSGLYAYKTEGDEKFTTKTRGMSKQVRTANEWMLHDVPVQWALPSSPDAPETWPTLDVMQTEFVTAGSAVASRSASRSSGDGPESREQSTFMFPVSSAGSICFTPLLYFGDARTSGAPLF